jgi:hypothetical protein
MRRTVSERLLIIEGVAAALAAADLLLKATVATPLWHFHQRSGAWAVLSVVLLVAVLALAFVPSTAVAVAAGVMSGGVIGNLVSARLDDYRVPNPLMLGNVVAFNLADVFFLLGNWLLVGTLIAVTLRNRDRLIPPRAWERALRRRLRA